MMAPPPPPTLCLFLKYASPDVGGGDVTLKLPSIPASKRIAAVKKAFVKAVGAKLAAPLSANALTLTRDGAPIADDDTDLVGRVFADGDVVRVAIAAAASAPAAAASRPTAPPIAASPKAPIERASSPKIPEEMAPVARGAEDALLARAEQQVFRTNAKIKIGGGRRAADAPRFYSQWAEDAFLSKYFLNTVAADGSFIELGACDGVSFSNTKYFEETLKFGRGLLIEPVPHMFARIATHRPKCAAVCAAITSPARAAASPTLEFVGDCETAGCTITMGGAHAERWHGGARRYDVPCRTMAAVLAEVELEYIDFFSLDVEGHEGDVLEGFPWASVPVGVLLFETLDAHPVAAAHCRDLLMARTKLRFAAKCGKSSAGCSEVWCDPGYARRAKLFSLPAGAPPARDGWVRAS